MHVYSGGGRSLAVATFIGAAETCEYLLLGCLLSRKRQDSLVSLIIITSIILIRRNNAVLSYLIRAMRLVYPS